MAQTLRGDTAHCYINREFGIHLYNPIGWNTKVEPQKITKVHQDINALHQGM
jgi:hypothetical protein